MLKKSSLLTAFVLLAFTTLVSASNEPFIVEHPKNIAECVSGEEVLTVKIVEGINAVYQWQKSDNKTHWVNIENANTATYTPVSDVVSTTWYRVIVTIEGEKVLSVTSNISEVTVAEPISVNINLPANKTICVDEKLHLVASPKGGAGNCTFQWQVSGSDNNWQNMDGETNQELELKKVDADSRYRVIYKCSGSGCCN